MGGVRAQVFELLVDHPAEETGGQPECRHVVLAQRPPQFRHRGYAVSQRKRKLVEQGFGWGKVIGLLRKLRHRGLERVGWIFTFTNAAYNLVRMRTLIGLGVCP